MYGIEYITASSYNLIVVLFAFIVMVVGSITDLQKREVADWINYGLFFSAIILRLLYATFTLDPQVIIDGVMGFIVFTAFGLLMFYMGQWGGGDTKMIIGLGVLFGLKVFPFSLDILTSSILIAFFINTLIAGCFYGVVWSAYLAIRNKKQFVKEWKSIEKELKKTKLTLCIISVLFFIAGILFKQFAILFFPLAFLVIFIFYSFIYTRSIEQGCMVQLLPPSKVTEGDWINEEIKVKGKYITGPKDLGISLEQIALLKKHKIKKVPVKVGIPFIPSFLLGFIMTFLLGNVVFTVLFQVL